MILRVADIPTDEMHLLPMTDLRQQIRRDRQPPRNPDFDQEIPQGPPTAALKKLANDLGLALVS